ncbi:MAG: hypothetical protein M1840_008548 [Geoglossum simile]|nr:MAG: hypothetical protein M1840_008548 [Geoglossum simile]
MASRSNPNVPAKSKRLAHPRKAKNSQKVTKARHTKTQPKNIHVGGQISSKKAKKLEKKQGFARKRAIEKSMEETGEVKMTGTFLYSFTGSAIVLFNRWNLRAKCHWNTIDAPRVTVKKDTRPNAQDAMDMDIVS